jgi:hypothetical protein
LSHCRAKVDWALQDRNRLIGGWDAPVAEVRACGEWELLLAEALTTLSLDVKRYLHEVLEDADFEGPPKSSEPRKVTVKVDETSPQRGHEAWAKAHLWLSILVTATNNLMPVAALLRMGLGKVSRKLIRSAFMKTIRIHMMLPRLVFWNACLERWADTVFVTTTTLARLCGEGNNTLSATRHKMAAHLVVDSKALADVEGLRCIRFAFLGLKRIRGLDKVSSNKDKFAVVAPFVVERLFAIVEDFGREPKENGVESTEDFTRLLTILGTPGIGLADTTVKKFVEVFKIFTSGNTRELDEDRIETYAV